MPKVPETVSSLLRLRAWRVGVYALPIQVCYFSIFYLGLKTGEVFEVQQLLLLVLSLWLYLAYIVLVNDYADRSVDAAVGKGTVERGHGLSSVQVESLLVLIVVVNGAAVYTIGRGIFFDSLWVLAYILGTTYSLPPFSLKQRGAAGLVVDSVIEKPLPILFTFAFFGYYGFEVLFFPILGELLDAVFKHQAHDYEIDVKTNLRTFAVSLGKSTSDRLVNKYLLPLDAVVVVVAFVTVMAEIPQLRYSTALVLAGMLIALALTFLKAGRFLIKPVSENWSEPLHWEDPPYVVFFNAGFFTFLTSSLALALVVQSPAYLALGLLFFASLAPYIVAYSVVALVRLKLLR